MDSLAASRFPVLPIRKQKDVAAPSLEDAVPAELEPSDEALISRIRERDQEALGLLFKRYARLVWSVAEKVLEDGAEAEDVMQEVFLLIYKKPFIFENSKGPARRLIVFVAYQSAFTRRRYLRARHAHATGDSGTVGATEAAPSAALYDESMEAYFGREKLRLALADISEDQRRTLRMHFFEGYTVSEIAQKLHQPQGNVKHHLYRGLEKLRKHLPRSENGG